MLGEPTHDQGLFLESVDRFMARHLPPEEVRRRYRDLVREHHPDRHIAAGVPEEMIEIATSRLQKINEAYDRIMKELAA